MELDRYKQAWKSTAGQSKVRIDTELLAQAVQKSHRGFQSTINGRDTREVGVALLLLIYWVYKGLTTTMPWTWWLAVPALIWIAGFILVDRKRHPQRPSEPGEPLNFYAKEALTQVEHQIWLLRNVFWWYLLPLGISIMAFFVHVSWNTSSSWVELSFSVVFWTVFVFVIYGLVYWLNQYAVQKTLEPRRQDLLKLVKSIESESSSEESDEVVDLIAAFNDPARDGAPGSEAWVANWNQIVPSWSVAMAIIVPTVIGGLCGLVSGFWLRIPEMGPVFFQAVVGAVIPFEIALFTSMYLSHRRKKQVQSTATNKEPIVPAASDLLEQSGDQHLASLPKSPALVILVLTAVIGILAILSLISFSMFEGFDGDGPSNL